MTARRVLVTGATGFIGARLAERLLERGHTLALLVRQPRTTDRAAAIYERCTIMRGDLSDRISYAAELRSFRPDTLVHVAWDGVAGAERNDPDQIANIGATADLLQEAIAAGVSSFVGFGSQAEYGRQDHKLDEAAPTVPTTLYGHSKLAACRVTQAMCRLKELRHAWLRLFSAYGPRDNPSWLIPSLITKLEAGAVMEMTACEQIWDFLYIDDLADAAVAVVELQTATGIFNLGSGAGRPLREMAGMLRDIVRPEGKVVFGALPYRPDQVMHLEADIARLTAATGWRPATSLEAGLEATARWFTRARIGAVSSPKVDAHGRKHDR